MQKFGQAEAIAAIVGTIIGAGVFTLPYMAVRSGLGTTFIWLLVVTFLVLYLHLAFGEVVLRTRQNFRLPGYVGYYLGKPAKKFILITTFLTFGFSLLLYLLLGTQFLQVISKTIWPSFNFPPGIIFLFLWLILSGVILSREKGVARVNFYLSLALIALFVVIVGFTLPHFQNGNINFWHFSGRWGWLIPYGVIFYSLNGMIAIPEAAKILKDHQEKGRSLKKVIIAGTLIPVIVYALFIIGVVGASGSATTLTAMQGLRRILGPIIIILGATLGLIAVATSYLIFANYIKHSFRYDFHWSPFMSYFLVIVIPLILYFLHLNDILKLVSFLGGMLGGMEGIMLILVFQKAKEHSDLKPDYSIPLRKNWSFLLIIALLIGALCQTFLAY